MKASSAQETVMFARIYFDHCFKLWGVVYFDKDSAPVGETDWHHLKKSAVEQATRDLHSGKIDSFDRFTKDQS